MTRGRQRDKSREGTAVTSRERLCDNLRTRTGMVMSRGREGGGRRGCCRRAQDVQRDVDRNRKLIVARNNKNNRAQRATIDRQHVSSRSTGGAPARATPRRRREDGGSLMADGNRCTSFWLVRKRTGRGNRVSLRLHRVPSSDRQRHSGVQVGSGELETWSGGWVGISGHGTGPGRPCQEGRSGWSLAMYHTRSGWNSMKAAWQRETRLWSGGQEGKESPRVKNRPEIVDLTSPESM